MASQLEFICRFCPLDECSEQSLFCAYRWATNPNRAQRKMMNAAQGKTVDRTEYLRKYYLANRDKKLAAAKERARRLREQRA